MKNHVSIMGKMKKFLLPKLGILFFLWMYWDANEGYFLLNSTDNHESVNKFKIAQATMNNVALDLSAFELKLGSRRVHSLTEWIYPHNQIILNQCVSKHQLENVLIKNGFTIDDPNIDQYYQSFCKDNFEFRIIDWDVEKSIKSHNKDEYCGYITFSLNWKKDRKCIK